MSDTVQKNTAKPRRTGVYISAPVARLLEGREGHSSLSGRLATVAERYGVIIEASRPEISEAEWNAVRDALNGVWIRDTESLRVIWAEIADADRLDRLGEKWGIDAQALAARVRDMRPDEIVALVEAVESWWAEQGGAT